MYESCFYLALIRPLTCFSDLVGYLQSILNTCLSFLAGINKVVRGVCQGVDGGDTGYGPVSLSVFFLYLLFLYVLHRFPVIDDDIQSWLFYFVKLDTAHVVDTV